MRTAHATGKLWMDAARGRWALRQAAGESRWQLAMHMARWLRLFPRQTRWLRSLDALETMRQAAKADPRLYERWHRPYISTHFDLDTRRRIVGSHYAFMAQRFPAPLRERIVLGHDVRLATIRLDGSSTAHLHLRKPARGDAGELNLLLLTEDKDSLASCVLTFDQCDSLLIGAIQGASPHAPSEATREFIQSSHGLQPQELLISLVRELAALHGLRRIRAVAASACVVAPLSGMARNADDAFWAELGGTPVESGCHELPLEWMQPPCAEGPRSRREKQQLREQFRREACETLAAAFRAAGGSRFGSPPVAPSRDAVAAYRGQPGEAQRPASAHPAWLVARL